MGIACKNELEKVSYALGVNMGEYFAHLPFDLNPDMAIRAMTDFFKNQIQIPPDEYQEMMKRFQQMMTEKTQSEVAKIAKTNAEAEEAFLAANKEQPDVFTTESGLQYKVITEGSGATPSPEDRVRVHYTGYLLNGKVFDSSVQRGTPADFGVKQVIPGWSEALQLMKVGSKYKLFIPSRLAYGEHGAGQAIAPNAMLIFEVELLDIL